jgi:hypothetical protein
MEIIRFGRRRLSFSNGTAVHTSTTVTERAYHDEDEQAFVKRLLKTYCDEEGSLEIVFKAGRPEYAIITISPSD